LARNPGKPSSPTIPTPKARGDTLI